MKSFPECHKKIWRVKSPAPALSRILASKLAISPVTAQLLINRGIYTTEQGRAFLGSELERLHSPLIMEDMKKAVARILKAVRAGENILIYGDYDADGITSAALLTYVFRSLGTKAECYLPNRLEEGYGLHLEPLKKARENGIDLVITVDCGISAFEEALWAGENGLDLIITDHHEPQSEIPAALAVVDPKRHDCKYPFKELAGVGVALKLAQALLETAGRGSGAWQEYLGLACLGTIADIMPIRGENRILVKHGLPKLANAKSPGIQALMEVSGTKKEELSPYDVGFGLAPRLNAAGRIGNPDLALRLLLTDSTGEARDLAGELNKYNQARQKIESTVFEEALKMLEENPERGEDRVVVLSSDNWHPGVIGIVASRLLNRLYRPVLLISLEGREGKGSARSIPGFNICEALVQCNKHLLNYGGHALAAGFTIERGKIEEFRRELNTYAGKIIGDKEMVPWLDLDGIVEVGQISEKLINELNMLQPFGYANPDPLLGCREAPVVNSRGVGKEAAHLKLRLRINNSTLDGIGFNLGAYAETVATAEAVDLAFVPGINEFNGRRYVELKVKDLGLPASIDPDEQEKTEQLLLKKLCLNPSVDLAKHKGKLFIPEFVLNTLGCLMNNDLDDKMESQRPNQDIELIDCRASGNRLDLLTGIVCDGGPALVIASCGCQAIELAHHLHLSRPFLKGKVAFCHRFTPGEVISKIFSMFRTGDIKVVVATPTVPGAVGTVAQQVLLYHLPYDLDTIQKVAGFLPPKGRLYLFFDPEDMGDNLDSLESIAPGRKCLAALYIYLRRGRKNSVQFNVDPALTAQALVEAGFPHSRAYTVRIAIRILEELRLLTAKSDGNLIQVTLFPAPSEKKELLTAKTYRHLHRVKEDSATFMKMLLYNPAHDLMEMIASTGAGY